MDGQRKERMPIPKLYEIPNANLARAKAHQETLDSYTIACKSCKKPLWTISEIVHYGTRTSAKKVAYPGVPEYNDVWSKDGKTCHDVNCPFCQEQWIKAVQVRGKVFAVPYVLELET
jgi:hypothetical protein